VAWGTAVASTALVGLGDLVAVGPAIVGVGCKGRAATFEWRAAVAARTRFVAIFKLSFEEGWSRRLAWQWLA
jgi:hypothetical protein